MDNRLTVPQEHGKDSTVEITEDIQNGYPGPTRILRFYTDQSLASNSGRAWNVRKAIEDFCNKRGYRITDESQHEITAAYSAQAHSYRALDSLRKAIQADARYERALTDGKKAAQDVQGSYGPAIAQLNALILALKTRARSEFATVTKEIGWVQNSVIADLELPPHLLPADQEALHRPLYQPEFDHYARYQTDLDNLDLDSIMALLR